MMWTALLGRVLKGEADPKIDIVPMDLGLEILPARIFAMQCPRAHVPVLRSDSETRGQRHRQSGHRLPRESVYVIVDQLGGRGWRAERSGCLGRDVKRRVSDASTDIRLHADALERHVKIRVSHEPGHRVSAGLRQVVADRRGNDVALCVRVRAPDLRLDPQWPETVPDSGLSAPAGILKDVGDV